MATRRIALMLDLEWPYKRHARVFAGTQQYAEEQGWTSIIDEFAHVTLANSRAKSVPYDGIIARCNSALSQQAKRLRLPLVNVWASSPVCNLVPSVHPDFESTGRQCAEHLLTRGFRNFATLAPGSSSAQQMLVQEFARVVNEAGFACDTEGMVQDPWRNAANWRKTEQIVERCMRAWQSPIGVYVSAEVVGRMLVQACHRQGWRVPGDVAIVAGQNEEVLCVHPRPSLTSFEFGFERVGYEAARQLHRLLDGEAPPSKPIVVSPQGLVVRESTDFFAVDNDVVARALSFISSQCHRSIGQDDVAKAVSMETRTLQNYFRKHLGRPIVAEIRRVRLERAKRELAQGKRSLAEIALQVGFGEPMRMYEVFRRELGVTPSEYRKQLQLEASDRT